VAEEDAVLLGVTENSENFRIRCGLSDIVEIKFSFVVLFETAAVNIKSVINNEHLPVHV